MPNHRDLSPAELHKALIEVGSHDRPPGWVGELVFDGDRLYIATGTTADSWKSAAPILFGWVADIAYRPLDGVDKLHLFYCDATAASINSTSESFTLVHTWDATSWKPGSPIDLGPSITAHGRGCYVLALTGTDGYGATDQLMNEQSLSLLTQAPADAATVFPLEMDLTGYGGAIYSGLSGFEVVNPLAQVMVRLERS